MLLLTHHNFPRRAEDNGRRDCGQKYSHFAHAFLISHKNDLATAVIDCKIICATTKTPDLCQVKMIHMKRSSYEARYILCSA